MQFLTIVLEKFAPLKISLGNFALTKILQETRLGAKQGQMDYVIMANYAVVAHVTFAFFMKQSLIFWPSAATVYKYVYSLIEKNEMTVIN